MAAFLKRRSTIKLWKRPLLASSSAVLSLALVLAGCGSGTHGSAPASTSPANPPHSGPQTYFSGAVNDPTSSGGPGFTNLPGQYLFDDTQGTFAQSTFALGTSVFGTAQAGAELNYSGNFAPLARGLLNLGITYADSASGPVISSPAETGSWAIELASQAGGLVALNGLAFSPLVAAESCPATSTPQTFQFITLPATVTTTPPDNTIQWDPELDTAYGTVDIGGTAGNVSFTNIAQFTIAGDPIRNYSALGLSPSPVAYTTITGTCSPTFYGDTISVPGTPAIANPGEGETVENVATLGIGPSGLLVESNGNGYTEPGDTSGATVSPVFQPFLGAGVGAMGLPQPSAPLTTSALTGAQYLGFFYGFAGSGSSTVASFGFPTPLPSGCAAVTPQTATLIYGGDFTNNDPSVSAVQTAGGFGTCDAAVDLGVQDPNNNGLFPAATVTTGSGFAGAMASQSLSAVAIAGMLDGKYAIFLLTSTGQGIYLLQSN